MAPTKISQDFHKSIYNLSNESEIILLNNIFSDTDADTLFDSLNGLPFNETLTDDSVRPKYDSYWFGSEDYLYSGVKHSRNISDILVVKQLLKIANNLTSSTFDCLLVNRYIGNANVPPHKDDEHSMDQNEGILAMRFGGPRDFQVLNNKKKLITSFSIKKGNGYFLTKKFQNLCYHQVPKSPSNDITITVTFRKLIRNTIDLTGLSEATELANQSL